MNETVRTGTDRLPEFTHLLQGKRIGLLTNPTGITSRFQSTVDVCAQLEGVRLTVLFACEHGIRGERQAGELFEDETDPRLGIPVFSLYGQTKRPTAAMMGQVDAVLFDIQDLGVRFYTYMTTMLYMMEACADNGKTFIVLDRPNPLGGIVYEGGRLEPGYESTVGGSQVPFRTGLTIGEYARYMNDRLPRRCDLQVIPLANWRRSMEYPDTGLPWIMPSPNMPTIDTVRVYAGNCLFEGTNLSEGRGTTRPFEIVGAPWLDPASVCRELNELRLPGVHFHPVYFAPTFSKHRGEQCGGIQTFVTDPAAYRAVTTALHMLHAIINKYSETFAWIAPFKEGRKHFIDYLTGSDLVRTSVHEKAGLERIIALWDEQMNEWGRERESYLLYKDV